MLIRKRHRLQNQETYEKVHAYEKTEHKEPDLEIEKLVHNFQSYTLSVL